MGTIYKNGILYGGGGGSSESGGHTIVDPSGADMTQRDKLQFDGYFSVSDDSTNGKTVVSNDLESITWTAYQALTDEQRAGRHFKITGAPVGGLTASDIGYNNTSSGLTADDTQEAIDEVNSSKVSKSGDTMSGDLTINSQDGTTSAVGYSRVILGNDIPQGTDENSRGELFVYDKSQYYTRLRCNDLSSNRNINFPNKSGTIALTNSTPQVEYPFVGTSTTKTVTIPAVDSGMYAIFTSKGMCIVTTNTAGEIARVENMGNIEATYNGNDVTVNCSSWYQHIAVLTLNS